MKLRLFFIIWIAFLIAVVTSSILYSELLKSERLRSLDAQIESLAGLLLSNEIVGENIVDLKEADEIIQEIIGEYRLGLVIILKNRAGKIIYRNHSAERLRLNPATEPQWQFLEFDQNIIRLLSKKEINKRTILQVGLVVNRSLLRPHYFSNWFAIFGVLVVLLSALIAFSLTTFLLAPLRKLASHLNDLAKNQDSKDLVEREFPKSLKVSDSPLLGRFDELNVLIRSIRNFLRHINSAFRVNLSHSVQLAHEIKTPLTVIRNELEQMRPNLEKSGMKSVDKVVNEVDQLAKFVDRYLSWGESINRPLSSTEIYAIHLEKYIPELLDRWQSIAKDRLIVEKLDPLMIFANASDFEHVLLNLLQNALKYSADGKIVRIRVEGRILSVIDEGPGIPAPVIEKLGMPFNLGSTRQKGAGLGLSLVHLICRKYNWKMHFKSSPYGTEASLEFPDS